LLGDIKNDILFWNECNIAYQNLNSNKADLDFEKEEYSLFENTLMDGIDDEY
jgi:hypothetical protein